LKVKQKLDLSFQVLLTKKRKDNIMKKVKNIFHKIANADPMIWGYVMLNDRLSK